MTMVKKTGISPNQTVFEYVKFWNIKTLFLPNFQTLDVSMTQIVALYLLFIYNYYLLLNIDKHSYEEVEDIIAAKMVERIYLLFLILSMRFILMK